MPQLKNNKIEELFIKHRMLSVKVVGIKNADDFNTFVKELQEVEDEIKSEIGGELLKNHVCCKHQTIKREDFCDYCLNLTTK